MQDVALGHDTPVSAASFAPCGFGAGTLVHRVPFQPSIIGERVGLPVDPTPKQRDALTHAMSTTPAPTNDCGESIGTIDHAWPFQRCASRPKACLVPIVRHTVGVGQA